MSKKIVLCFVILSVWFSAVGVCGESVLDNLSKEEKMKLATLLIPQDFRLSKEYKDYQWTLNQFFTEAIYKELLGTPFTGFEYDEGLKFKGKEIQIEVFKMIGKFRESGKKQVFKSVVEKMFKKNRIRIVKKSRYRLGVCVVNVNESFSSSMIPWIWVELFIRDVKENTTYFLRYSVGSRTGLFTAMLFMAKRMLVELEYHREH